MFLSKSLFKQGQYSCVFYLNPFCFLCSSQSLFQSLFLSIILISHYIPFMLYFSSYSVTHSHTDSHSFILCLSPSPHSQSTLLFHLLSSLARSCCHWSVLASLHFSYQTRAHLATVAGLSSDWGCPDYEGSSL